MKSGSSNMMLTLIEEDRMNAQSKIQADTTRATVPQHILDRFENAWQQMRANASVEPKSIVAEDDKR
jgi:hypothetical protein